MKVLFDIKRVPPTINTVLTVGNFDGVHMGHRELIGTVVQQGRERALTSTVLTFEPHPIAYFRPDAPPVRLTTLEEKLRLFDELGVAMTVVLRFDREMASMSAREFVEHVLCHSLHAREVHEGANFLFGRSSEGDMNALERYGEEFGFSVKKHTPMRFAGRRVSSSRIREELSAGNHTLANAMLRRAMCKV